MRLNIQCPFCKTDTFVDEPEFEAEYICPHCGKQFGKVYSLAKRDTDFSSAAELIASQLKKDVNCLISLGIKLDKGALAAKTGGLGWAGYEAFTGDWLSALIVGGVSLLAGTITDGYKRIKLQEVKQRWLNILSDLNEGQLSCLMATLERKYPLLLPQVRRLLQA